MNEQQKIRRTQSIIKIIDRIEKEANELKLIGNERVDYIAVSTAKNIEEYIRGYEQGRKDSLKSYLKNNR